MIKRTLILLALFCLDGCSIASFEKGLNYKKNSDYKYEIDDGSATIKNKENGKYINTRFGRGSYCGRYGIIGPLIFPIIPIWQRQDCGNVVINIWEHSVGIKNAYIIYHNKIYNPSKISKTGYYTFPLQTKSISDTATLVVEKKDGEKFEIPFRYQHTFSFDLWPGR